MLELKPLLAIILSAVTGLAISHGYMDASNQALATQSVNDLIGGLIIVATAIASLHRYVVLHPVQKSSSTSTVVTSTSTPVVQYTANTAPTTPVVDPAPAVSEPVVSVG